MKKVITYGTFDLFHIGHLRLLERLRNLGDHLTVFVSSDEFSAVKSKTCAIGYAERAAIVAALRCVDEVYPEHNWEQKISDIERLGIHLFGMGHDWAGKFDFLRPYCEVVYLPRTDGVSSTLLKEQISQARRTEIVEIIRPDESTATTLATCPASGSDSSKDRSLGFCGSRMRCEGRHPEEFFGARSDGID